ncbi:MAG: hypothetical protein U1D30_23715 [Planctomycetota bacterium]
MATPLIERKLLGGMECLVRSNSVHDARGDAEYTFRIGPSLQLRPTNRTFVTMTPLFGTTGHSPYCEAYLIAGYQFGYRAGPSSPIVPVSTIGN